MNFPNKNRAVKKPSSGYQNIKRNSNGTYTMFIGSMSYGLVDMSTPDAIQKTLALRDERRSKLCLGKADY